MTMIPRNPLTLIDAQEQARIVMAAQLRSAAEFTHSPDHALQRILRSLGLDVSAAMATEITDVMMRAGAATKSVQVEVMVETWRRGDDFQGFIRRDLLRTLITAAHEEGLGLVDKPTEKILVMPDVRMSSNPAYPYVLRDGELTSMHLMGHRVLKVVLSALARPLAEPRS